MISLKNNHYNKYILFSYLTIFINITTGFILFPMILKSEGMEALGVFGILFALKSIFYILVSGTSSSFVKSLLNKEYLESQIFSYSLFFHSIYGILCFTLISFYGKIFYEVYFITFIYFGLFVLVDFFTNSFYEIFLSKGKQHLVSLYRFILQFLFFIFILLLNINNYLILENIFLALFLVSVILFFIVFVSFIYFFNTRVILDKININNIKKILIKNTGIYLLHTFTISFLFHLDVILIDYFYGSANAGIYLILFKIPNTLIILGFRLSEPFRIIVSEKIKLNLHDELLISFNKLEKKILLFSLFVGIMYVLLGEYILVFWIGAENVPHIKFIYIICFFIIVLSIMQEFYTSVNFYTRNLDKIVVLNLVILFVKICFIVFLFDTFGELSPLIGWAIILSLTIYFYRKNSMNVLLKKLDKE